MLLRNSLTNRLLSVIGTGSPNKWCRAHVSFYNGIIAVPGLTVGVFREPLVLCSSIAVNSMSSTRDWQILCPEGNALNEEQRLPLVLYPVGTSQAVYSG